MSAWAGHSPGGHCQHPGFSGGDDTRSTKTLLKRCWQEGFAKPRRCFACLMCSSPKVMYDCEMGPHDLITDAFVSLAQEQVTSLLSYMGLSTSSNHQVHRLCLSRSPETALTFARASHNDPISVDHPEQVASQTLQPSLHSHSWGLSVDLP